MIVEFRYVFHWNAFASSARLTLRRSLCRCSIQNDKSPIDTNNNRPQATASVPLLSPVPRFSNSWNKNYEKAVVIHWCYFFFNICSVVFSCFSHVYYIAKVWFKDMVCSRKHAIPHTSSWRLLYFIFISWNITTYMYKRHNWTQQHKNAMNQRGHESPRVDI